MRDTLLAVSAIGLTAPHIGVPERVVVIRLSPDEDLRVYVNPEILWRHPTRRCMTRAASACRRARADRAARPLRFGYRDLDGSTHEEEADGFPAAVIQHEIDQLDGIFWIDRLSRLKRDRLLKRFEKTKSAKAV